MAINPNISLAVKPLELADPLAQYGRVAAIQQAQQQNALANMQMQEYARAREEEQSIRNRLAGGASLEDAETRNFLLGSKSGRDVLQRQAELLKASTDEASRRAKLMADTEAMYRNMANQIGSKQDAVSFLQQMLNDPGMKNAPITKIPLADQIARIPDDPQGLDNWIKQFAIGATKWTTENKPVTFTQDVGAGGRLMSLPGLGGAATVVPGSEFTKTLAPGEEQRLKNEATRIKQEGRRIGLEGRRVAVLEDRAKDAGVPGVQLSKKELQARESAFPKATTALKSFEADADELVSDLERLKNHPGLSNITGVIAGRIPSLTAQGRAAQALYDKIIAKGGFQSLQDVRNASPTGGALGSISNQEGQQLKSAFSEIDQKMDAPDVRGAIDRTIQKVRGSKNRVREGYDLTYEYRTPAAPAAPAAGGVKFLGFE